jgi:hypothetical protein
LVASPCSLRRHWIAVLYGYYLQETVRAPRVAAHGTVTVTMLHGPGEK